MAHRALTLKYRPQVFADLIGQDHVSSVLARALEADRVAHAFLFTGARGVGKTTSARILAKALNCEKRLAGVTKGADPCNACTSCTEITTGVSLDVVEIDGASNRGIADVQSLREKVRFAPATGKYRVVIIDEVHQLSADAFAALLKTLEEPPAHLVFIFATTDPQKLPDTIRSRTQRFDFARVALRKVADRLLHIAAREQADADGVQFELADAAALLIAHKGEGSMRDSVSALDQVVSAGESQIDEALVRRVLGIPDREGFFLLGEAITGRNPAATLQYLHRSFEKGMDPRDLAEGLAEHFRSVVILKLDPEKGGELVAASDEDQRRYIAQGKDWLDTDLLRLVRIAAECQWPMRDSPQPIVHLEAAVLQMATLESADSVAALIARLEALETRLAGLPAAGPARSGPSAPPRTVAGSFAPPSAAPSRSTNASNPPAGPSLSGWSAPPQPRGGTSASAPPTPAAQRPSAPRPGPTTASLATAPPPRAVASAPAPSAAAVSPAPLATTAAAVLDIAPVLDAEIEERWKAAIAGVTDKKRMLGVFLENCRLTGVTDDALVLAVDGLQRAVVDSDELRALLLPELQRLFGRALLLQCTELAAGDVPRVRSEADMKPLIDRAIQFFDGEVLGGPGRGDRTT